jgi:hypothetical protein
MRLHLITALALGLLALAAPAYAEPDPSRVPPASLAPVQEPRLSRVATHVAGRDTAVWCYSAPDWTQLMHLMRGPGLGYYLISEWRLYLQWFHQPGFGTDGMEHILINPDDCARLQSLASGKRPGGVAFWEFSKAVNVLSHEAVHASGVLDEAVTECYALQHGELVARLLGASRLYAWQLAAGYWRFFYRHMAPTYRSSDCYDGGPLDLNLGPWPK